MRTEIRFSGLGGQGIILSGIIAGKAASLFDHKHATMTQSFGPEARGSACSAQLIVSDEPVFYPYITKTHVLVSMSQDACDKFLPDLIAGGTLLVDEDLVNLRSRSGSFKMFEVPATRYAEELGNRILGNLVMLGYFSAITRTVSPESFKKAIPGSVPQRYLDLNIHAFDRGFEHGISQGKQKKNKKSAKVIEER